ncbi:hypothetical protein TNCV_139001 [Trichonephila clavipes]|nr:hypothetical protein TNCV_139001 [Trichonephila clavipes]
MPPNTSEYTRSHGKIVEVEIGDVVVVIIPSGNFAELIRTVTCMVPKAQGVLLDPCHDEFRGLVFRLRQAGGIIHNNNNTDWSYKLGMPHLPCGSLILDLQNF